MAENITTSSPIKGEDNNQFNKIIEEATKKVERLDRATAKADKTLKKYAETFDSLNDSLKEFIKSSDKVELPSSSSKAKSGGSGKKAQSPRLVGGEDFLKSFEKIFKAVGGPEGGVQAFKKYSQRFNDAREVVEILYGKSAKGAKGRVGGRAASKVGTAATGRAAVGKTAGKAAGKAAAGKAAGAAAGSSASGAAGTAALGATAGAAATGVGLVVASLWLMAEAGKAAHERNLQVSRSLMSLGSSSEGYTQSTIDTANKMIDISNTWSRIGNDLTYAFEPFFDVCVDFVDWLSSSIEGITSIFGKEEQEFTTGNSRVRWYSSQLEASGGDTENKSLPVLSDIASSAKQSGFTNESAANLAIGTYDAAVKLAKQYGLEASKVAEQLSDAWLNGSDAAKEYGVVVDDQVLAGYMASKGVDIVNTEISDAMKQYYRYQLMLEQASASNSDYMQDQVKEWKELGMMIDKTKGKLFAFDEVIQLSAMDPTIPDVGTPNVSFPDGGSGSSGGTGGIATPPGVVPGQTNTPKLEVEVVYKEEPYSPPVIPPVYVPVVAPGLDVIPQLVTGLAYIYSLLPMPVTLPVSVPGLEWIPLLQENLGSIPTTVPVNVPVTIPGFDLAYTLLQYCIQLSTTPFTSVVNFMIPSLYLAPTLLNYLDNIAQKWDSTVDISVAGENALQRALRLLTQVRALLSALGQSVVSGAKKAGRTIRSGVSNAYNTLGSAASGFVVGLNGGSNKSGLLSSWSPTSADAYGGGLLGALKADLDLNLVRLGLKSSTKEGYSQKDILSSYGGYLGYNLNPFNNNSATNLMGKGAVASGVIASGLGALGGAGASLAAGASAAWGAISSAASAFTSGLSPAFADGGIGTREIHNATLFEDDKKEAVIPLETSAGIQYLSDALKEAGLNPMSGSGDTYEIHLTLSGLNIADNNAQWEKVGRKIAEVIDVQRQRRGELNYGSSF